MSPSPIVIAHRGASGYLPEHTLAAKVLAYGQGADFLEQDVVATRDGELVVLHDIFLDEISDVRKRYPDRARQDGHHYVIDFDLAELRQLSLCERRRPGASEPFFPGRFGHWDRPFRVVTLAEEIELIQNLNRTTGRNVGIYAEVKEPAWHRKHDVDLSARLLELLQRFDYRAATSAAYVQCFDAGELRRLRNMCTLKLVQLVDANTMDSLDGPALDAIREYADALAPPYRKLMVGTWQGAELRPSPAAEAIRQAGLLLHPYTFRRDQPRSTGQEFERLLAFFYRVLRVDGVFCDHPDVALRVRARVVSQA